MQNLNEGDLGTSVRFPAKNARIFGCDSFPHAVSLNPSKQILRVGRSGTVPLLEDKPTYVCAVPL